MGDTLQHDFKLGEIADDMYSYTLGLCGKKIDEDSDEDGKKKKKTYRFPLYTYPNYVSKILDTAADIHMDVIVANESRNATRRRELQDDAMGKCIYLNHLIRLAKDNKWISDKQLDHWLTLTNAVRWGVYNWRNSDARRQRQ